MLSVMRKGDAILAPNQPHQTHALQGCSDHPVIIIIRGDTAMRLHGEVLAFDLRIIELLTEDGATGSLAVANTVVLSQVAGDFGVPWKAR